MVIPFRMTFDLLYSIMDDIKSLTHVLNALSIKVWMKLIIKTVFGGEDQPKIMK